MERTMPRPSGIRENAKAFDAEFVNADRRGHDVDDRIGRADFVEVDVVDGDAMDFGFGFSQAGEDCKARCFDFAVEFGCALIRSRICFHERGDSFSGQMTLNCVARIAWTDFLADLSSNLSVGIFFNSVPSFFSGKPRSRSAATNMSPLTPPIRSP